MGGGAYNNVLNPLLLLQRRIIKIIKSNKYITNDANLNNKLSKILDVKKSFMLNSLIFFYGKLQKMYKESRSTTRNKIINLPQINLTLVTKSAYIHAIREFNVLSNELKQQPFHDTKKLKKKLSEFII